MVVESAYLGRPKLALLGELEKTYMEMVREAVEYAVENNVRSLAKLHKALYKWFREKHPDMPTRLVKGAIADAARRAKSFQKLKKQGRTYTDKPMVRRVTVTYPDSQDWRLQGDAILLRTHRGWLGDPAQDTQALHQVPVRRVAPSQGATLQDSWPKANLLPDVREGVRGKLQPR